MGDLDGFVYVGVVAEGCLNREEGAFKFRVEAYASVFGDPFECDLVGVLGVAEPAEASEPSALQLGEEAGGCCMRRKQGLGELDGVALGEVGGVGSV